MGYNNRLGAAANIYQQMFDKYLDPKNPAPDLSDDPDDMGWAANPGEEAEAFYEAEYAKLFEENTNG